MRAIDFDQIIQRVREEAVRPEYQGASLSALESGPSSLIPGPAVASASVPGNEPVVPLVRSPIELLLIGDERECVDQAYRLILGRHVDPCGLSSHLALLQEGLGALVVVASVASSPEARALEEKVPGLFVSSIILKMWFVGGRLGLQPVVRKISQLYHAWLRIRLLTSGLLTASIWEVREANARSNSELSRHGQSIDSLNEANRIAQLRARIN